MSDPDHARAKSSVLLYEKLLGESAGETTEETSEYTAQFASGICRLFIYEFSNLSNITGRDVPNCDDVGNPLI